MTTAPLAMLPTEASLSRVEELISSPAWIFQQKMDGTRAIVHRGDDGQLRWTARNGAPLRHSAAAQHFAALNAELSTQPLLDRDLGLALDGEILINEGTFHVFDVVVLEQATLAHRLPLLDWLHQSARVHLVPAARSESAKREMWEAAQRHGIEGLVAKRLDALYQPGRRVEHQLKLKLTHRAECVITSRNDGGKLSAKLGAYDDAGVLRHVGGCSMIGKPDAQVGDVVEVEFLYATKGNILYQPRLIRVRTDKAAHEATLDQLKPYSRARLDLDPHS